MVGFPRVGVGVIIMREKEVLLGKRMGSHGNGTWSFPGGHLEVCESFIDCAKRETMEETGLEIGVIKELPIATNDFFEKDNKHYVTIHVRAKYIEGEAEVLEKDKCEEWKWFLWEEMPEDLFLPIKNLKNEGYNPFTR